MCMDDELYIHFCKHRLLTFEDNWVLLEAWFSQFNNLVIVDANGSEGINFLYSMLRDVKGLNFILAVTQKFVTSKIKELKKV